MAWVPLRQHPELSFQPGKVFGDRYVARTRNRLLDALAVQPWPVGLAVGLIGLFVIRWGIPAWLFRQGGQIGEALAQSTAFAAFGWLFLIGCSIASLVSFLNAGSKRRLLDTRTGLESVSAIGWRNFEELVGEAFRRQGYVVEETGLGGADGGIDLVLRGHGRRVLVQCKQWRRRRVPVNVVREMYGLLQHHGADEVQIATVGGFTRDAERFARGKPIRLIDGQTLLAMIRDVQEGEPVVARRSERVEPVLGQVDNALPEPKCPRCNQGMVQRTNRREGSQFWGCTAFPRCKGTRAA